MKIDFFDVGVIQKIEVALGFELYPWQKQYLQAEDMEINPNYRWCGNSTIYAVKKLLTLGVASDDISLFIDHGSKSKAVQHMMRPMIENIDYKLKKVGFKTNLIEQKPKSCTPEKLDANSLVKPEESELKKMSKIFLIPEHSLVVLSIPCILGKIDKEEKERIKSELKEATGMDRALVVEGSFKYIP
nr:MAG TPA: hypothetical protein [Caudoviricetes sp.]